MRPLFPARCGRSDFPLRPLYRKKRRRERRKENLSQKSFHIFIFASIYRKCLKATCIKAFTHNFTYCFISSHGLVLQMWVPFPHLSCKCLFGIIVTHPSGFRRPSCRRVSLPLLPRVCCLLGLSKNVGTYEPSFGSLCTVTFLAKRKRVPANSTPAVTGAEKHAGRKGVELGRMK